MKDFPYKLRNPRWSNVNGCVRPDDSPHKLEGLANLRFSPLEVVLLKRDPDHKQSWGFTRKWCDVNTKEARFAKPSVVGFGFKTEGEAQKTCERLNRRMLKAQGKS